MRLHSAFFAAAAATAVSCWFAVHALSQATPLTPQQPPPALPSLATRRSSIVPVSLDPPEVTAIAGEISQRARRFKPLFGQVYAADWVAKGAPETYIAQWNSIGEQNAAVETEMADLTQHPDAMPGVIRALFRLHRFDGDLMGLLPGVRRYQSASLADQMESVAASDQRQIEKLQQYVLDLANGEERMLDIEDKEAQRCRASLASQPIVRPAPPKKTNGSSK